MKITINHVPTTIITGFLGTGKTSTIINLLKHKPKEERWAILVNEFGTIGIDGTLYKNTHKEQGGVFVREVPGGCMCCVSGLPMQIALNVLLKLSNPHRLLIEPSGLGHPVEILTLLKSQYYKDVLDIQKVITLIDPRQFLENKYFNHPTYQQQLTIADTIVVNKTDLCSNSELTLLSEKMATCDHEFSTSIYAEYGLINPNIMTGKSSSFVSTKNVTMRTSGEPVSEKLPDEPIIPIQPGFIKSNRFDEGYHASSWRYHKGMVFSKHKLMKWIESIDAERIKGIFNTDLGALGLNIQQRNMHALDVKDCKESRLEIISLSIDPMWDEALNDCVVERHSLIDKPENLIKYDV